MTADSDSVCWQRAEWLSRLDLFDRWSCPSVHNLVRSAR